MQTVDDRRGRLARLIELAQTYRGWGRNEIARALGRDPGKVLPDSGNPKLDLVVSLAQALDWPLGTVAEDLGLEDLTDSESMSAAELDAHALACHRQGDWRGMVMSARRMLRVATLPVERAVACNRAAGGFDGLGLYVRALPYLQAGLAESGIPEGLRLMLTVNLANAHYVLWHLVESRAASRDVLDAMLDRPPQDRREQVCQAFALYVRGSSARRMAQVDPGRAAPLAAAARPDLERSLQAYEDLADTHSDPRYAALANTCRGALLEVDTILGHVPPMEALESLQVALDRVVDVQAQTPGDWLESWGWWCIFGCNVVLRHLGEDERSRPMAIFTNKAIEIADRLDNWSLRERAFSMDLFRHDQEPDSPWSLDEEEIRGVIGTMGRFPAFRDRGYRILRQARLVLLEGGPRC
jgi:hypothetical protein